LGFSRLIALMNHFQAAIPISLQIEDFLFSAAESDRRAINNRRTVARFPTLRFSWEMILKSIIKIHSHLEERILKTTCKLHTRIATDAKALPELIPSCDRT